MEPIFRTRRVAVMVMALIAVILSSPVFGGEESLSLPEPSLKSDVSIEQALVQRRSLRTYADKPVTLKELSQLLWAAQGITEPEKGFRTAPSDMARYPLTAYTAVFNATGVPQGVYRYEPAVHNLVSVATGNFRDKFKRGPRSTRPESPAAPAEAPEASIPRPRTAGHADPIPTAMAVFVITVDTEKSRSSSGYYLEAGHVAQNIVLQCVSLDMGGVTMAGFSSDTLKTLLKLSENEAPIYVIPVGKK